MHFFVKNCIYNLLKIFLTIPTYITKTTIIYIMNFDFLCFVKIKNNLIFQINDIESFGKR